MPGRVDDTGLFPHITNRRTDRTPFSGTVPTPEDMEAVQAAAGGLARVTAEPKLTAEIRTICETAARIEFMTPRAHGETVDLMRVGRKAVKQNPDGINIEGPMIELLNLSGALGPDAMRDHDSTAFKQGMNMYIKAVDTAPSFLWIVYERQYAPRPDICGPRLCPCQPHGHMEGPCYAPAEPSFARIP